MSISYTYLSEQQLLVCQSCKYYLHPNSVYRHLQTHHLTIPLTIRKELFKYTNSLTLRGPTETVTPVRLIPAFECIKVIDDGCRCLICCSLSGTIDSMKYHCRSAHG